MARILGSKTITIILGLGVTGRSVAGYLQQKSIPLLLVDDKETDALSSQAALEKVESNQICVDRLILSPGIPQTHPLVQAVLKKGGKVLGDVELAFEELASRQSRPKIVGITGTNGKTTTTLLIAHILQAAGIRGETAGNIDIGGARPVLEYIDKTIDCLVLELSSYQLETMVTPLLDASVFLNLTPDHLDRYQSLDRYAEAKFRIFDLTLEKNTRFLFDQVEAQWPQKGICIFGRSNKSDLQIRNRMVYHANHLLGSLPEEIEVAESHDAENFLAAFAIAHVLGVSYQVAAESYTSFSKPPHRIQYIDSIDSVTFWDDSKGTNIDATIRAVQAIPGSIILIAGGVHKGEPYSSWRQFSDKVQHVVTIGQAAEQIEADLDGVIPTSFAITMQEAVEEAFRKASKGFSVLLSPGCSSFDMFRDYKDRGQQFQKTVRALKIESLKT